MKLDKKMTKDDKYVLSNEFMNEKSSHDHIFYCQNVMELFGLLAKNCTDVKMLHQIINTIAAHLQGEFGSISLYIERMTLVQCLHVMCQSCKEVLENEQFAEVSNTAIAALSSYLETEAHPLVRSTAISCALLWALPHGEIPSAMIKLVRHNLDGKGHSNRSIPATVDAMVCI